MVYLHVHARAHGHSEAWILCSLNTHCPWVSAHFHWSDWKFHKRNIIYSLNLPLLFLPCSLIVKIEHKVSCYCHFKYFELAMRKENVFMVIIEPCTRWSVLFMLCILWLQSHTSRVEPCIVESPYLRTCIIVMSGLINSIVSCDRSIVFSKASSPQNAI